MNDCVATGFNLWDYEGILEHRPRVHAKQCGNLVSDERPPNLVLTNNAGSDVVWFQIWFVLEPDGLLLSLFGACLFSFALMIRFAPLQLQRVNRALGSAAWHSQESRR